MSKTILFNSKYIHYWNKLQFEYSPLLGRVISTKPCKKYMKKMKTLAWRIKRNKEDFIVNSLGIKSVFPPL